MPADPNVYRDLKPIAILSPQQYQQQRLDQQMAVEDRQAKLQASQEQRAAQDVLRRFGSDPEAALSELQRVSPSAAISYQTLLTEQRKSALDALKTQTDVQKARTERGLQLLSVAKATKNPAAYQAAISQLAMDDEDRQAFPAQLPDDATLDQLLQMGLSVKDQYDLHERAVGHYMKGDLQKGFALSLIGAGDDPDAWQEAVQAGIQMGVPKALASTFAQPSPENVARARDLSLTEQEKETIRHNQASEVAQQTTAERMAAQQAETARHNRAMEARPVGGSGGAGGALPATDTDAIADAIIRGEQPPVLTGLYSKGAAVRAALAKKGYNLADAQTDWTATQKHLATLNGAQQTRLRQAVDNAYHSLDVIEDLAKQWDGGRFPLLNKAQLAAAKNGALGKQAQQIATTLEAQISDVTSELGNVYMGGNSPTDHALSLAAKNLSAEWNKDQLLSALKLARKNLEIRNNSMNNVSVAGVPSSQYMPTTPGGAQPTQTVQPIGRFNPKTGKVEAIQ